MVKCEQNLGSITKMEVVISNEYKININKTKSIVMVSDTAECTGTSLIVNNSK